MCSNPSAVTQVLISLIARKAQLDDQRHLVSAEQNGLEKVFSHVIAVRQLEPMHECLTPELLEPSATQT